MSATFFDELDLYYSEELFDQIIITNYFLNSVF